MGFFKSKKEKELIKKEKELENKLNEIKTQKEMLQKEKESLLKIKEMMENTNNYDYIDITNVYVLYKDGIYSFVELKEEEIVVVSFPDTRMPKYKSTLIDIFTNQQVYQKISELKIEPYENVFEGNRIVDTFSIRPIYKKYHDLLIYVDKKVPRYILQYLYYELNGIDITKPKMQKYITKNTD